MRMSLKARPTMEQKTVKIDGMSCQHCVMALKKSFQMVDGIEEADVEIGVAKLKFDVNKVTEEDINEAVTRAGYKIKG